MRLGVVVLVALAVAASAGGAPAPTQMTIFRAYQDGKPAAGLKIVNTLQGDCFAGSSADLRSDAWRCMVGNSVADPCFSDPAVASWVLCPLDGSPFGKKLLRISLSKALPKGLGNHGSPGQGLPWTVKLAGGKVCTILTGATFPYHGKRVNYGCDRTTFLAGPPNRSRAAWTIVLGKGPKSPPRVAVVAEAVW